MDKVLWVDSHCHPQYESLGISCIQEAYDNDVSKICCVGTEISEHEFLMKCKEEYKTAIAIGEHPLNDFFQNVNWNFMESIIKNYNAIGETGFDFQADISKQIEAFEIQAALAEKYNLPVILHIRDAGDGKIEKLAMEQLSRFKNLKGVFHCFVGTQKLVDFAIQNNFFISFSGIITFKKSQYLREVMKTIPLELFLIETDAPYLAPVPKRGKPNHPMYVKYIGEFISQFLKIDEFNLSEQVIKNFDKLYYQI